MSSTKLLGFAVGATTIFLLSSAYNLSFGPGWGIYRILFILDWVKPDFLLPAKFGPMMTLISVVSWGLFGALLADATKALIDQKSTLLSAAHFELLAFAAILVTTGGSVAPLKMQLIHVTSSLAGGALLVAVMLDNRMLRRDAALVVTKPEDSTASD